MRVRATATGSSESNAIGQLELSCTPAGLLLGMYGVGAYSEGYATGALTMGTQFTVPYSAIKTARVVSDHLYLEFDAPGLPHDRLTLSRFSAGPGVPPLELKRRRLILHFTALSVAALACLAATILAPSHAGRHLAWGALGYGALAGSIILALGFSLDRGLFLQGPGEEQTREAFVSELSLHYPAVLRGRAPITPKKTRPLPNLAALLPRTAATVGMTLAATILTALVMGQRVLMGDPPDAVASRAEATAEFDLPAHDEPAEAPLAEEVEQPTAPSRPTGGLVSPSSVDAPTPTGDTLTVERRCLCDRATSQLWVAPIPRLSGVLIDKRAVQLKSYVRTEIQIAVVNNGDTPVDELTLHVQFYERRGGKRVPTKERPLYFEGPLRPGEAIKWKAKARGTEFEIIVPDLGILGPSGDGAASAAEFRELLRANHRPVRLHAARMLSYLGDEIARKAALDLKDAMRAAEAPYLRRILAATGQTRVCDLKVSDNNESATVCVYNASDAEQQNVGVQLNSLDGLMNVDQPLADPPSLVASEKWALPESLAPLSGLFVSLRLPAGFLGEEKSSLEALADRYDLLD
jgi:hypothetical protein